MIETSASEERVLVVTLAENGEDDNALRRMDEEAINLLDTLGLHVVSTLTFPIKSINSATYIGSGQAEEVKLHALQFDATLVYFDTALSGRNNRNLEALLELPVMDRNELIIEIFATRARTREARLQVALARCQFLLPRLKQGANPYSQQRGGVRGAKGEGERQIELDRRRLEEEIGRLKKEIETVRRQRRTQRKRRLAGDTVSFALVGYTNSGKSSLLKALTGQDTFCEDKLFATLDPLERTLELDIGLKVLLCDTVGFVSRLPHFLIDAFSSTLEEATLADALILVLDGSDEKIVDDYETTLSVLGELEALDKTMAVVFNKCDMERGDEVGLVTIAAMRKPSFSTSAKTGEGLEALKSWMKDQALSLSHVERITLALDDAQAIAEVYAQGGIISADYQAESVTFTLRK